MLLRHNCEKHLTIALPNRYTSHSSLHIWSVYVEVFSSISWSCGVHMAV